MKKKKRILILSVGDLLFLLIDNCSADLVAFCQHSPANVKIINGISFDSFESRRVSISFVLKVLLFI